MTDIVLETVRAVVLMGIVIFLWKSGRGRFAQTRKGWNLIILGFGLLLFGSVLDISDNFDSLSPYIVIGDTEAEAFLEKFVGFLGGFVLLAIGLFKWIPGVQGMSELVDERTKDLQELNFQLVLEIESRERAQKKEKEFISTVSHELRTPLTSIKGSLGLIQSGTAGELPDKLQQMLDIAYSNSDRLVLLINDILDIEKIESGQMSFDMKPIRISSLISDAIISNKGYGDQYDVTFVALNVDQDLMVQGDKDRLMQVLSNLMSNAAKFSPAGEQVSLSVSRTDGVARVVVLDKGPGISEEFRAEIFEKFSQADSSDTRQKGGTGLALSISKAIIEHHGGTIGFESAPNVETSFFFTLPLVQEPPARD